MSRLLYKKRIKREVKNNVKAAAKQAIIDRIPEIKERLLTNFIILEEMVIAGESVLDLAPFKQVFTERVEDFEYIPEEALDFTLKVPSMENFDFTGIEFLELVFEGIVGDYAEATYSDMIRLFGMDGLPVPINTGLSSEPVYLLPINDWLLGQENTVLGYSLNRSPFSNTEPLESLIFGEVQLYVSDNFDGWVSQAIKTSVSDTVKVYGGK